MQLCQCRPNREGKARSSLFAVLSHLSSSAVVGKERDLGQQEEGRLSKQTRPVTWVPASSASMLGPVLDFSCMSFDSISHKAEPCQNAEAAGHGTPVVQNDLINRSALSSIYNVGRVNMTLLKPVQRLRKRCYLQVTEPALLLCFHTSAFIGEACFVLDTLQKNV